jgi:hypothetical protein
MCQVQKGVVFTKANIHKKERRRGNDAGEFI